MSGAVALVPMAIGTVLSVSANQALAAPDVKALEELGKRVFFDPISRPRGRQACASCHDPGTGWTGPNSRVNATIVANPGAAFHAIRRFGGRFTRFDAIGTLKPPTAANAALVPVYKEGGCNGGPFVPDKCGGVFWNGRAEGVGKNGDSSPLEAGGTDTITPDDVFGVADDFGLKDAYKDFLGPVAEQALNPFENPKEQNTDRESVCKHVQKARYTELFEFAWGEPIACDTPERVEKSYKQIAVALAAYQASSEVTQRTSKRDKALIRDGDGQFPLDDFTNLENWGHDLFYAAVFVGGGLPPNTESPCEPSGRTTEPKAGNCVACHNSHPGDTTGIDPDQFYADPFYHNIGIPYNRKIPNNPGPDKGLGGHAVDSQFDGEFRTPTLRNVDLRPNKRFIKAYGHNGYFKSLESIVHFYNTADVDGETAARFGIVRCPSEKKMTEAEAKRANCWPEPETKGDRLAIPAVVGDLHLNSCDESAIVAYLKTLSDTKRVRKPGVYRPRRR